MTEPLLIAIPFTLLALVSLLGFVGCTAVLDLDDKTFGEPSPSTPTDYASTILQQQGLVAFWRLNEPKPADPALPNLAVDSTGNGHDGTYVDAMKDPDEFPCPDIPGESAPALGTLTQGAKGIVGGDMVDGVKTPCMDVDGGYVSVPFDAAINPQGGFSIEAWVRVEWSASDLAAFRMVVDCRNFLLPAGTNPKGFALYATPDNHWEVVIGMDAAGSLTATSASAIKLAPGADITYLVAMYNDAARMLMLYVDGQVADMKPLMATDAYVPNDASHLFIGAGAPYFQLRTVKGQTDRAPLTPFRGLIQDVALYSRPLGLGDVTTHLTKGKGP